jgi:predicted MPP superfamily phosphohydrolase
MVVTRRTALRMLLAGGVGAISGVGAFGYLYGRHELEVTRATVPVAGLSPALQGLRIGLLTDVHRSRWVSHEDVARAVATLQAERPDLIAARGVQMLKDARTHVQVRGETIDLVGIRYWTRRGADIARVLRGAGRNVILLAHDPRRLTEAAALQVPLVLSGHTHGGQVVLPVVGAIAAQKFPVVAGLGQRGGTTIFVSRGLGTVYVPVRVNCPPEVAILTIVPEHAASAA